MADWTDGYVADVGYTFGYYTELNPLRLKLAFLNAGLAFPEVGSACELGFGQGVSANVHAAASVIRWWGTDFNPTQAALAQEMGAASGSSVNLTDQSFTEFCDRSDLPDFDFIGLHGIWSWISDDNRKVIVDFIRRKLKVGGVVYVSYNTLTGWMPMVPIRELLTDHAEMMAAPGQEITARIGSALDFAEKLVELSPAHLRTNPQVGERLKKLKDLSRNYLAHEYFNRDWHPMSFSRMSHWLAPAKLSYACSANYTEQVDALNLTPEQKALLQGIPNLVFRETVRDFITNQNFRKDYWVKGARKLSPFQQVEALRAQRVLLTTNRKDITYKASGVLGEATMNEAVYRRVLDVLEGNEICTIGDVEKVVSMGSDPINFAQLIQAMVVLAGKGNLCAAQDDELIGRVKPATDRLNRYLIDRSRGSEDITFLASPVTGGGVAVGRLDQLFILARANGLSQPLEWTAFAWKILSEQGKAIVKDGVGLKTKEDNLTELNRLAALFAEQSLPILETLKIV